MPLSENSYCIMWHSKRAIGNGWNLKKPENRNIQTSYTVEPRFYGKLNY